MDMNPSGRRAQDQRDKAWARGLQKDMSLLLRMLLRKSHKNGMNLHDCQGQVALEMVTVDSQSQRRKIKVAFKMSLSKKIIDI